MNRQGTLVSIVELTWFFTPETAPTDPGRLLSIIRRNVPEAMPKRFGQGDPPPTKVTAGDLTAFVGEWERRAADEVGLRHNWIGSGAVWFASVKFPDRRPSHRRPGVRVGELEILLGQPFVQSETERVVRLFSEVAEECGAFYACGFVLDRWRLSRGVLFLNAYESDVSPLALGGMWLGLPPGSPWLSWLGPEYADLLGGLVADRAEATGRGLLIRTSPEPTSPARAQGPVIAWPEEVLARRRDPRFPGVPPSEPAAVMPEFSRRDP